MIKLQFTVYGIVQGVGFRYFTRGKAKEFGLSGVVRNLSDGSVLVIACGDEAQLDKLREWLWQGPRYSRVDNVVEQIYLGERKFDGFSVES